VVLSALLTGAEGLTGGPRPMLITLERSNTMILFDKWPLNAGRYSAAVRPKTCSKFYASFIDDLLRTYKRRESTPAKN
jgi:hypothetical protein